MNIYSLSIVISAERENSKRQNMIDNHPVIDCPTIKCFKPIGVRMRHLKQSVITANEFEALRLKDYCDMDQTEAAKKLNISQPTFCRLIKAARKKIMEALINNQAIQIGGGTHIMSKDIIKVAVCAQENSIDSKIDSLFGRAPYFIIFTIKNNKVESFDIIKNEGLEQTGRAGISTAKMLAEHGIQFVIGENIGPRALNILQQFNIGIFTHTGLAKDAVEALIKEKLNHEGIQ